MENTSFIALSRQGTLRRQMNVIANNLANINTTAFKGEKMMFIQHLVRSRGGERILGEKIAFVRDIATVRDTTEGPHEQTGNPLDVAIRGEGHFVVETENGARYTRNGRFQIDAAGRLVTQHGDPVLSTAGPLFFTPEDGPITIARDGTISTENGQLGRLRIVRFENELELEAVSGGLYQTDQQPEDVANPNVVQNMLERSNIEPIIELTRMIDVHRAYNRAKTIVDAEDERIKKMVRDYAAPLGA
jgi:flagellar basal-body rod protein FlgF